MVVLVGGGRIVEVVVLVEVVHFCVVAYMSSNNASYDQLDYCIVFLFLDLFEKYVRIGFYPCKKESVVVVRLVEMVVVVCIFLQFE